MAQIIHHEIASVLNIHPLQVEKTLELLIDQAQTVPFIARYRKEVTKGLDEVQIRSIQDHFEKITEREKRRLFIADALEKMEKLTPELKSLIQKASSVQELEDLYAPYKSKRKTKAQLAKEAGLEPFAQSLLKDQLSIHQALNLATHFLNETITDPTLAFNGAKDIITEMMAHDFELKQELRNLYSKHADLKSVIRSKAEEIEEHEKFQDYFDYQGPIHQLMAPSSIHRYLAIRRGMMLKILKVTIEFDQDLAFGPYRAKYGTCEVVGQCLESAYKNYIHPSLELEIQTELKQLADEKAIDIFKINLHNLLLMPYLGSQSVLGVDPGVRTGCKLAVVSETGDFLIDTVIYPHPPQNRVQESARIIQALIDKFKISYIAIGNGTYGRETLAMIKEHVKAVSDGICQATLVSEAGASVYSASELAAKEFPDLDLTVRGAISIARRFQDPLAELVKIDPKAIGVGQYQHDVNQTRLKQSLEGVVESCVNFVGVDVNTASAPLLSYVSGIGPALAQNIVSFRQKKGIIKGRHELKAIPRFSEKIFEQSAGFLRVVQGEHPLDATFIHPERYELLESWAAKEKIPLDQLPANVDKLQKDETFKNQVGPYTFEDIIKSLQAKGQDPRTEFQTTAFRTDINSLSDVKTGQYYTGVVTNITQFGAFIDIGIKVNGLIHISQMADHFVSDPFSVLKVGQEVKACALEVDLKRQRLALSLRSGAKAADHSTSSHSSQSTPSSSSKSAPKNEQKKAPQTKGAFASLANLKIK